MPTNNEQLQAIIKTMQGRQGADDAHAIGVAMAMWEQLTRKFGALLGPGGVRLIYQRSLDQHRIVFPWLPTSSPPDSATPSFAVLEASFRSRDVAEALAAHDAVLHSFIDLLATLIGARLTMQFLRTAFPDASPTENKQENQE